ncbi:efflux RND transporter periplasmic adaptor subunit [Nevskia soli]|uniref:efflux RND transporter periplasmic adaptor subunit n=1 Tax=Nevskia soli TaxID=418856 RepID=UPI0004A72786|nr:efflux RND transporter periplasmic adaptor subunit [Nevskia soli]
MSFPELKLPVVVAMSSVLFAACGKSPEADPRLDVPLVSVAVVHADGQQAQAFTGIVAARVQSDLGFRVAGKITQRLVDVGQHVQRGQPLMRLDPNDLHLGATAQRNTVESARANAVRAEADLVRLNGLVEQGAISAQAFDRAKAEADSARAQLAAAEQQAGIALNADNYSVLAADFDGVVVSTRGEPGQVVAAGQTVLQLAKDDPREAAVNLPEAVRLPLGAMGKAVLYGVDAQSVPVRLRELSESADPLTRTFPARFVLQGAAENAPLGMTVTVYLSTAETDQSVEVPIGALYDSGHGPGVWMLDAKRESVSFHHVTIGRLGEETAVVTGGLNPGQHIVALGAHLLHEGERVRAIGVSGNAP